MWVVLVGWKQKQTGFAWAKAETLKDDDINCQKEITNNQQQINYD